jgi:hypothetical protein
MPVIALTITNSGHGVIRDGLTGADNPKPVYFALGTSNAAVTSTQTQLVAEVFRKKVTSVANGASVGEALINVYVSQSDVVGVDIEEIAVFCGASATSTRNSGKMLGRALWSHNPKTNLESITLQLDATA